MAKLSKPRLGPESFRRVYNEWAQHNNGLTKSRKGDVIVIPYESLSIKKKEKFSSFLFKRGVYLRRENKQWYLEAVDPDDSSFTMFALRYQ